MERCFAGKIDSLLRLSTVVIPYRSIKFLSVHRSCQFRSINTKKKYELDTALVRIGSQIRRICRMSLFYEGLARSDELFFLILCIWKRKVNFDPASFYTAADIPDNLPRMTQAGRVMLLGSCFAANMGTRLQEAKFQAAMSIPMACFIIRVLFLPLCARC